MLSFNFSDIELSERPSSLHRINEHQRLSQRAVTGTPKPPTTELNDIFISVKTTKNYHDSRLALIIKTWFQLAKEQVCTHLLLFLLSFSYEIYGNLLVRIFLSCLWLPFMVFQIYFGFTFWMGFRGNFVVFRLLFLKSLENYLKALMLILPQRKLVTVRRTLLQKVTIKFIVLVQSSSKIKRFWFHNHQRKSNFNFQNEILPLLFSGT